MAASAVDNAAGSKSSSMVCVMLTNQNRILNSGWSNIKCYFLTLYSEKSVFLHGKNKLW